MITRYLLIFPEDRYRRCTGVHAPANYLLGERFSQWDLLLDAQIDVRHDG